MKEYILEKQQMKLREVIYADLKQDLKRLRLRLKQLKALVQLLLSIIWANIKHSIMLRKEKKKYGSKAYDMNLNVVLMAVYDKNLKQYKEKLVVADNNEIITLARTLHWLPKRMTASIMQKRKSVFYTTTPKMKLRDGIKMYMDYIQLKVDSEQ